MYAALLPVVGGVALACLKELDFSWVSFGAAMASNLLFALRANFSKVSTATFSISNHIRDGSTIKFLHCVSKNLELCGGGVHHFFHASYEVLL